MPKQFIAVGGGKGGVGKSLISANLAIALAQRGKRTVLIDADLGGANLHTMFGIDRPQALLEHFLSKKVASLNDIRIPTAQKRLELICGGMPVLGTANPKHFQKLKLIRHIRTLDFDTIVVDIGAGTAFNVLDLFNAAEYKVVAFTPQLTSLHNGYGFLKAAVHRYMERLLDKEIRSLLQTTNPEAGAESLGAVLKRIATYDRSEAEKAQAIIASQQIFLVGNMIRSEKEKHVVNALRQMIGDHLLINAELLGALKFGEKLERSVNDRRPFMLSAGIESNAELFRNMASRLIRLHQAAEGRRRDSDSPISSPPPETGRFHREDPRYPVRHLPAILNTQGDAIPGTVVNVAHGGMMVAYEVPLPPNTDGKIAIGPSKGGISFEVEVEERHRSEDGSRIGYSFLRVNDIVKRSIDDLVAEAAAATAVHRISQI